MPALEKQSTKEFFGGAITCSLPEAYLDASDIGPIPDNQEVWVDGDKSLIIEIVEFRAELLEEEVGRFYWQDLVTVSESSASSLEHQEELGVAQDLPGIPSSSCSHAYLVRGRQVLTKSRQHPSQGRPVAVWLAVLRLPTVQADLLLTANFPSEEGLEQALEQEFMEIRTCELKGVLRTLRVQDWSLFVNT